MRNKFIHGPFFKSPSIDSNTPPIYQTLTADNTNLTMTSNPINYIGLNVLEELKEEDCELYMSSGDSHLSGDQWDYVIQNFKNKLKIEEK